MQTETDSVEGACRSLATLPSELRKLIVSHLVRNSLDVDCYLPGSKRHLKNANLAHRCLHEWATEYLFRDMALKHVVVGIASNLELFAMDPAASLLWRHVKTVQVQVPPAIRWEVDAPVEPTVNSIEEGTEQRLLKKFGARKREQLTFQDLQYCSDYHRALVEPFTDNRRWYKLQALAEHTWPQILQRFPNLDHTSVGICKRDEHPSPTRTYAFVHRYGEQVLDDANPPYVEDAKFNLAWASAIMMQAIPSSVKSLHLTAANSDSLNSFATINRLLALMYDPRLRYRDTKRNPLYYITHDRLASITNLVLDLRGKEGTHGSRDWRGLTGSVGMVRYWRHMLESTCNLKHLDIRAHAQPRKLSFYIEVGASNSEDCILEWLLPQLALPRLESLTLRNFFLHQTSLAMILGTPHTGGEDDKPYFRGSTLVLEDCRLWIPVPSIPEIDVTTGIIDGSIDIASLYNQLDGGAWLDVCSEIEATFPGILIHLVRPRIGHAALRERLMKRYYVGKFTSSRVSVVLDDVEEPGDVTDA
ncbi:hypothetical protein EJ04DRAFT_512370 [Polyplosphaeria fusca]|uniref:Uncharacterized protein n=1 Tax=Polyplosphaeria fusca TaxID=682080 RepID=A0A9P4R1B4_9PLEO|nr:hypothetical protein EJ04DRAFT_512370 [Polyplosphaeria fusca]